MEPIPEFFESFVSLLFKRPIIPHRLIFLIDLVLHLDITKQFLDIISSLDCVLG